MIEAVAQLREPSWWISVVVAGFLVNVIAAYAKPLLDNVGSRISAAWRARSEATNQNLERAVWYLLQNPAELADLKVDTMRTMLKAILVAALATLLLLFLETVAEPLWPWLNVGVYFGTSVWLMSLMHRYLKLARLLAAYEDSAHTAVSRYLTGQYPEE